MARFGAFPTRRLCDVVFPGTHDAGVYGSDLGATAKTQELNILEQAMSGVRYFDVRIATVKVGNRLEQRAYHAPKLKEKTSNDRTYHKPHVGKGITIGTGKGQDRLTEMLDQSRKFVIQNPSEFLILRFSKCGNMEEVVNQCLVKLGNERFSANVNLNEALISSLQGKVITVFDYDDFVKFPTVLKQTPGILPVKALFDKEGNHGQYLPMWGLQYFGKYSNTRKAKSNVKKQAKILAQGPTSSPELLGMMYWTLTTGKNPNPYRLFASIQKRDRKMWNSGQQALISAWEAGVKEHIVSRAGHLYNQWQREGFPQQAMGRSAKSFIPNIIMMDFADPIRCATIWSLNETNTAAISEMSDFLLNVNEL